MSLVSLLSAAVLMLSPVSPADPVIEMETAGGTLVGRVSEGVAAYKGVPYAAPPVGPLRWRPPQPARRWEGPRDAGHVGALCIQPPPGGDPGVGPLPMSEDCLTLNVWTPVEHEAPAPIMVWIHGGAFNNGSGTAALYDGTALARRGVVLVTINYRLGRLGFFDHPALAAERARSGEAGGNYALMDMIAALEWVRDNAEAFGGDPSRVTIFGESAGAAAVTRLMIAPRARGLFQRAAVQSGLGRDTGSPLDRRSAIGGPSMQERGTAFARQAGLGGLMQGSVTAAQLRALPAERLLSPPPSFYGGDNLVIDGKIVSEDVEAAFAEGRQAAVPLLIGTNSAEFWWIKPTDSGPYGQMDDAMTGAERERITAAYGGEAGFNAHVVSDLAFNEPARHLARLHARAGHPTYLYRFDVVPDPNPEPQHEGATHAAERPYVFDNLAAIAWPFGERDHRAAQAMAGYWTRFAGVGDPNAREHPYWPDFRTEPDRLLEFTNDGPAAKAVPFKERLDLLEAYYRRTRGR